MWGRPFAVAVASTLHDDLAEVRHLARAVGARERRQRRGDEGEIERRRPPDLGSQLDDTRIAGEAAALLGAGAEVGASCRRQPRIELGQAAAGPHGGQRRGQPALGGRGVVGVRRGDAADVVAGGQLGEHVVASRIERVAVVPQLDEDTVAPERLDQPLQLPASCRWTVVDECSRDGTLTAAGQRPHVAGGVAGDVAERELRRPLLPRQMPEAQRAGEAGVAPRTVGEQQEVVTVRIGGVAVGHPTRRHLGQWSRSSSSVTCWSW